MTFWRFCVTTCLIVISEFSNTANNQLCTKCSKMRKILISSVFCMLFAQTLSADNDILECYHCVPVTTECHMSEATPIKCGGASLCGVYVRKGAEDKTKAIRKCVIPDAKGHIPCVKDFECHTCNTNFCTWAPPPPQEKDGNAATLPLCSISWISVLVTMLYIVD